VTTSNLDKILMFRRTQVEATVFLFTSSFREDTIAGILIIRVGPGLSLNTKSDQ